MAKLNIQFVGCDALKFSTVVSTIAPRCHCRTKHDKLLKHILLDIVPTTKFSFVQLLCLVVETDGEMSKVALISGSLLRRYPDTEQNVHLEITDLKLKMTKFRNLHCDKHYPVVFKILRQSLKNFSFS